MALHAARRFFELKAMLFETLSRVELSLKTQFSSCLDQGAGLDEGQWSFVKTIMSQHLFTHYQSIRSGLLLPQKTYILRNAARLCVVHASAFI